MLLLGGIENGYDPNNWDTNDNGYSDHDEYYGCYTVEYSQVGMGYSYYDWDGDGYKNHEDSHPFDGGLYNDWDDNGYNDDYNPGYDPGGSSDSDGDGYYDEFDSHPYDSSLWNDWNYNGTPDDQENGPGEMDSDGDGHWDYYDSHPYDQTLWEDWNGNGTNDSSEEEDSDGDGYLNSNDSHPYDSSRWCDWDDDGYNDGTNPGWTDSDADLYSDDNDSHPYDSSLWSDWDGNGYNEGDDPADSDGDGYLDANDSHPNNNMLWNDWNGNYCNDEYETLVDRDGDGALDDNDSHPDDARYQTDRDHDGLESDFELSVSMTDPDKADSDEDGLNDGLEYLTLHTNPNQRDSDGDGLTDFEEVHIHPASDPLNPYSRCQAMGMGNALTDWQLSNMAEDTDGDGIPNPVENVYGLNPNDPSDAEGDLDADEITNLQEFQAGTSLWGNNDVYDTDRDGITDLAEDMMGLRYPGLLNKLDPSDATKDPDKDGVLNFEEVALGLNPLDSDSSTNEILEVHTGTASSPDLLAAQGNGYPNWAMPLSEGDMDGDGISDYWEHYYRVKGGLPGLNHRDPTDWDDDPDGDSLSNRGEVLSYRHPFVADYTATPVNEGSYTASAGVTTPYVPQVVEGVSTVLLKDFNLLESTPENQGASGNNPIFEVASETKIEGYTTGDAKWTERKTTSARGRSELLDSPCRPLGAPPGYDGQRCPCQAHGVEDRFYGEFVSEGGEGYWHQVAGEETIDDTTDDGWEWVSQGQGGPYWVMDHSVICPEEEAPGNEVPRMTGIAEIRARLDDPATNRQKYSVQIKHTIDGSSDEGVSYEVLTINQGETHSNIITKYPQMLIGKASTVTLTVDSEGADEPRFSVSAQDSAGPKYRKVGLNGIPVSDSQPIAQSESGELPEDTYIDAYLAQIRHSVSDVYATTEDTLIPLQVRRDVSSASWNDRFSLQPDELPTEPFGPGWKSNICSYVHFIINDKGYTAEVVDEMGAQQIYKYDFGSGVWVHSRQEYTDIKSFQNTFSAVPTTEDDAFQSIKLMKKFGT